MDFVESVTKRLAEDASAGLSDITEELVARRSKLVDEVAELVRSGVIGKNPRLLEAVTGVSREVVDAA
jgi:hypothetical protein